MKIKIFISIVAVFVGLAVFSHEKPIYADNRSGKEYRIYDSIWQGTSIETDITMDMRIHIPGEGEISWEINGKALEHVEYEYVYSNFPNSTPFLCIYAREGDEEHIFHGIFSVGYEIPLRDQIFGVYKFIYPCPNRKKASKCAQWFNFELYSPIIDDK